MRLGGMREETEGDREGREKGIAGSSRESSKISGDDAKLVTIGRPFGRRMDIHKLGLGRWAE
jgi:hypothetical protein